MFYFAQILQTLVFSKKGAFAEVISFPRPFCTVTS